MIVAAFLTVVSVYSSLSTSLMCSVWPVRPFYHYYYPAMLTVFQLSVPPRSFSTEFHSDDRNNIYIYIHISIYIYIDIIMKALPIGNNCESGKKSYLHFCAKWSPNNPRKYCITALNHPVYRLVISNIDLGTRCGWVVSATHLPRFTPGNHWIGGWVGLKAGLDRG
jgi:hypothetical protein